MSFCKNFMWGAATAAFQVEGAYAQDGKGPSIWDELSEGKILHGDTGNVAADHYRRWREDIALMREIGINAYRFSVSWARIFPSGDEVNERGLAFYRELVRALKEAGIEPVCTLYHWDLPMWLHERGGWLNEETALKFAEFARTVCEALSEDVRYWITINEPQSFICAGYESGVHAPFESYPLPVLRKISRIVMLAHGMAVREIREWAELKPFIGYAPTASVFVPYDDSEEEIRRARERTFSVERAGSAAWWSDPIVAGVIPDGFEDVLSREDMATICQPLDFYAFNVYTALNYEAEEKRFIKSGMPRTAFGWVIDPKSIYWAAKFFYERYRLPILVTENGMANVDFPMHDKRVRDPQRIEYIRCYLTELKRASEEGIPVVGYFYWSLLDNLEWAMGYDMRFGLIYVDFQTQERTLKDSAYYYRSVIEQNGEDL